MDEVFRIVYRPVGGKWYNGTNDWHLHTSRTGNNLFNTESAAKGAITQAKKRAYDNYEFQIQRLSGEWNNVG